MESQLEFLRSILDSITDQIVVINELGEIQFVNRCWSSFGDNNGCVINDSWVGVNYLDECDKAATMGDDFGLHAASGIRSVISHAKEVFYFEYPCHSPDERRWFMMRVTPFKVGEHHYYVISHQNITERKLAEEKVESLASIDGLTQIPNRRAFDHFLHEEWSRCHRLKKPMSLLLLDADHFKLLNDTYGHQTGDQCLVQIGAVLKEFAKRPSDICARYGGEEFTLVLGDTTLERARLIAAALLKAISELNIEHKTSPTAPNLTLSIGLAAMVPDELNSVSDLIALADSQLYKAKQAGRNRFVG